MKKKLRHSRIQRSLAVLTAAAMLMTGTPSSVYAATDSEIGEADTKETVMLASEEIDSAVSYECTEEADLDTDMVETEGIIREDAAEVSDNSPEDDVENEEETGAGFMPLALTAETPSVTVEKLDGETGDFTIRIRNIILEAGEAVIVPTWSAEMQKDLVWYTAEKDGADYVVSSNVSRHGYNVGTYNIHVYRRSKDGTMNFLVKTGMDVLPSTEAVKAVADGNTIRLTTAGLKTFGTERSVEFAVWSQLNGQDDLHWYPAVKQSKGVWAVSVPFSAHRGDGVYNIHTYVWSKTNKPVCVNRTRLEATGPEIPSVNAEVNSDQTVAHLSLKGYYPPADMWEIRFAVWSKDNGQDDLRWYSAKTNSDSWTYDVKIADHRSTGEYIVHCYLAKTDGSVVYLGPTSFIIEKTAVTKIEISDIDKNANSFLVNIETDPANTDVRVAVWSQAGQQDLNWYFAKRIADGKYQVQVERSRHKNSYGTYQVHVYSYKRDVPTLLGTTSAVLKLSNQITITDVARDSYRVVIRGAEYDSTPAASVTCPTWTVAGGQDDLVWYKAEKQADGSYAAIIRRSNHLHDGICITDVYVKNAAGQQKFVGRVASPELASAVQPERPFDAAAREVMRNIIYAVETGGMVYGAKRYDAFKEAGYLSTITAITIGAGQWYSTEAKTLLSGIRSQYPDVFEKYDTAGIGYDLDHENWKYYGTDGAGNKTILSGSPKALAIQAIISTPEGKSVQDALIDEQMAKYVGQAEALGVTDLKAKLFCANIQHLGSYSAVVRIVNYCKSAGVEITMENMWTLMRENEAGSGNMVGSDRYASRHRKVMEWLDTYL